MGSDREIMQAEFYSSGASDWDEDDYYEEEEQVEEEDEDDAPDDDDGYDSDELPPENIADTEDMVTGAAGLILRGRDREEVPWTVLSEEEMREKQEEAISTVEAVLSIRRADASLLLRNMGWCVNKVNEEWFAEEEKVREKVGLLEQAEEKCRSSGGEGAITSEKEKIRCDICFEYDEEMRTTDYCSHSYCVNCWTEFVRTSINDGPGYCLSLRCPHPHCKAAVGDDLIFSLLSSSSEAEAQKYKKFILRSYVESNRKAKWCPAPGCENAVEFNSSHPSSSSAALLQDVTCKCGHCFCWNCNEEAHRPVNCSTVSAWLSKNSADADNVKWILANSKPCPKCNRPIEKNNGCMHMTCTPPCRHEFCWLCLGSWDVHSKRTFYDCNRYQDEKKRGVYSEDEKRKEMANSMLDRYCHYYERWVSNGKSKSKAMADLRSMRESKMEQLSNKQSVPISQLHFLTEAWEQIIECRRVLKWTYAYGYYLSTTTEDAAAKKRLFEYLQGEAEAGLERLHKCAEKDVEIHLPQRKDPSSSISCTASAAAGGGKDAAAAGFLHSPDDRQSSFNEFRARLIDLTTVTRNYFRNLVRALENGLADVQQQH